MLKQLNISFMLATKTIAGIIFLNLLIFQKINAQSTITLYTDSILTTVSENYNYGVFYVPKTAYAQNQFINNENQLNAIRLNIIESVLNNASNLNEALNLLDSVSGLLQTISSKTSNLIFIFEKMPYWLSSSSDNSPAQTPGWYVFNTKPPANYTDWNTMVYSIVDRIVNVYGISNASFEIWNEPDLGSWTGTKTEYFTLFKQTFLSIKNVNQAIPIGGPATNYWGNNINYSASYGHLDFNAANSSLIANLIDSAYNWGITLDFISWHNFNLAYQVHENAQEFILNKYASLNLNPPKLIISEWNAPSAIRDFDIHKSFAVKNINAINNLQISNNVIAAWQDFDYNPTNEFQNDYGLLTYQSIKKPFYYCVKFLKEIKGNHIKSSANTPIDNIASYNNDTLRLIVNNYSPPPFIEALNHTLLKGKYNLNQLDSAGYINISLNGYSYLDSIYKGEISITNNSGLNSAINNSIPIYQYYNSIKNSTQIITISVAGNNQNFTSIFYEIDSTKNNSRFMYDSLLNLGYTSSDAVNYINTNFNLKSDTGVFQNGVFSKILNPNAVMMLKIHIPGLTGEQKTLNTTNTIRIYPNPTQDYLFIVSDSVLISEYRVLNIIGEEILKQKANSKQIKIDCSNLPKGIYTVQFPGLFYNRKFIVE